MCKRLRKLRFIKQTKRDQMFADSATRRFRILEGSFQGSPRHNALGHQYFT